MDPTAVLSTATLLGLTAGGIAKGVVDTLRANTTPGRVPPIIWPITAWLLTTALVALLLMQQAVIWNQQSISLVLLAGVVGAFEAVSLTEIHNRSEQKRQAKSDLPLPAGLMARYRSKLRDADGKPIQAVRPR